MGGWVGGPMCACVCAPQFLCIAHINLRCIDLYKSLCKVRSHMLIWIVQELWCFTVQLAFHAAPPCSFHTLWSLSISIFSSPGPLTLLFLGGSAEGGQDTRDRGTGDACVCVFERACANLIFTTHTPTYARTHTHTHTHTGGEAHVAVRGIPDGILATTCCVA